MGQLEKTLPTFWMDRWTASCRTARRLASRQEAFAFPLPRQGCGVICRALTVTVITWIWIRTFEFAHCGSNMDDDDFLVSK